MSRWLLELLTGQRARLCSISELFHDKGKGPQSEAANLSDLKSVHSKIKLCAKLHDARATVARIGVRILAKAAAVQVCAPCLASVNRQTCWRHATRWIDGPVQVHILEVRMIEHVERLEPKLEGTMFIAAQLDVLEQRHIPVL